MHTEGELILGHRLERAEVRLSGRTDQGVEGADPVVHGRHGVRRSDVYPDITGGPPGDDHVMPH